MITPVPKQNLCDNIFNQMMDMIATKQWEIDSKIPSENELKTLFQVSRNTVRQAIHRLSALGLLEARQGEGTFVKQLDLSVYMNILIPSILIDTSNTVMLLEFERGLQIESARLACERRTESQLDQMKEYVQNMQSAVGKKSLVYLQNDIDYHVLVCDMSFNPLYIKSMQILKSMLFYSLQKIVEQYNADRSIDFHTNIMHSILARDQASAIKLMAKHMDDVILKMKLVKSYE